MSLSQAFIFAAGEGKRMRPLTKEMPKPLLKIKNKAIIGYSLDKINNYPSIKNIIINAYYLADKVQEFINLENNPKISLSYENSKIETGGALIYAKNKIDLSRPLLITNGDIIWSEAKNFCEISYIWQNWQEIKGKNPNCKILLGLKNKNDIFGYDASLPNSGDFDMQSNNLYYFLNKPTNFVYTGMAIIDPSILDQNIDKKCFSFSYFIKQNIDQNGLLINTKGIELKSKFFHIGDCESYYKVQNII
jgi:MurNAc alpha-1-phosphate uridylyltransferase